MAKIILSTSLGKPLRDGDGGFLIPLSHNMFATVDSQDYERLNSLYWRAIKSHYHWYAKTRVRTLTGSKDISMHRLIMKTPFHMECHHINGNTLDNRRANLKNLNPILHAATHATRRILRKK